VRLESAFKSVNCPRDELPLANCSTWLAQPQRKLCRQISSSYVEQSSWWGSRWWGSPSGADSAPDHCCCRGVQNRSGSLGTGYWVLGNIRRYWIVLLLEDVFFRCDTQIWYWSDSSRHRPHDNHFDVCGAAVISRQRQGEWGAARVQAIHRHLRFYVARCCIYFTSNQYTAMLHTSMGIGIGYWYH